MSGIFHLKSWFKFAGHLIKGFYPFFTICISIVKLHITLIFDTEKPLKWNINFSVGMKDILGQCSLIASKAKGRSLSSCHIADILRFNLNNIAL